MATTTTTITPDAVKFPFTLEGTDDFQSNTPRAEVYFNVKDGPVTVAAASEDQLININFNLPANFVYALAECFVTLQALTAPADLTDWQDDAYLVILDGTSARMQAFCPLHADGPAGVFKCYYARSIVDRLVIGGGSASQISITNPVVDGAAMQVEAMVRFWQYDVNQRQHVGVQTPSLIRGGK